MHLDWLSLTIPYHEDDWQQFPHHPQLEWIGERPALSGYDRAMSLKCGAIYCVPSAENKRMRRLLVLSGEALQSWRETGDSDDEILAHFFRKGSRFTRLDSAFDTDDPTASPDEILQAWEKRQIKSHFRTVRTANTHKRDKDPAKTVYLGSASSGRQVIIYDKAKQMKLLNEAWVRVELRAKKGYAQQLAHNCVEHGVEQASRATIRQLVSTEIAWFESMMDGNDVDLTELGRKATKGAAWWFLNQVFPVMKKAVAEMTEDDRRSVLYKLCQLVDIYHKECES